MVSRWRWQRLIRPGGGAGWVRVPRMLVIACLFMIVALTLAGALAGGLVRPAWAAAITVTSDTDVIDANGGVCAGLSIASLPGADTVISLREAICAANTNPGADTIGFAIPGAGPHIIAPLTDLPAITGQVFIDGYTEPGSAFNTQSALASPSDFLVQIELDGGFGVATVGLTFDNGSDGSTVRGLSITAFADAGIFTAIGADGISVQGNYIGLDAPDGLNPDGNGIGSTSGGAPPSAGPAPPTVTSSEITSSALSSKTATMR